MKLKTAFKLSAVAIALTAASTTFAATHNTPVINDEWKDPTQLPTQPVDTVDYQYLDVGSKAQAPVLVGGQEESRPVYVAEHIVEKDGTTKAYYLVDDKQILKRDEITGKLVSTTEIDRSELTQDNFERGGTSTNYKEQDYSQTSEVKRVDTNFVKYGEETTITKGKANGNVAVTDAFGNDVSPFEIDVAGVEQEDTVYDEVILGIVNKDGKKYGVYAETVDANGTSSTSLTSNGLATTGNVSANTITLAGKDITTTIAEGDAATLTAAQDFAKVEDAKTLQAAKAADVEVLVDAKSYTDAQFATFNNTASRLNKRIDDVEETAYRGVAIALAAQQQIPNIGAGQFAVFGGVGHYEGESAAALGLASVFADGRTSLSAALGAAGNGEIGGRVGMAYVFGGK